VAYLPYMSTPPDDDVPIPNLMRAARGSYAQAVVAHLARAGYDDLPRNGAFVLANMAFGDGSAVDIIKGLGVTKQAASQLIDTLVLRGYLTRDVNPDDRRRMVIALTERGRDAASAVGTGAGSIDSQLAEVITPEQMAGLRIGLAALGQIKDRMKDER
jgi:DNA-binding MarR family transcriptional regulator